MKNEVIISAIIGAIFFAITYLGLTLNFIPSLFIGICAFVAGNLLIGSKKEDNFKELSDEDIIEQMKYLNQQINSMIPKLESEELKFDIREIVRTNTKIIQKVEIDKPKIKKIKTFIDYYLPVTLKILIKYDEIENQHLNNKDSKEFMRTVEEKIKVIENAFKGQLASLFQDDLVDVDAELGVLENMLKSEGYTDLDDFDIQERGKNNG